MAIYSEDVRLCSTAMRMFRAIVEPFMRAVFDFWHNVVLGSRVGAEPIGDHLSQWAALPPQQTLQQVLGGLGVAARLDDIIKHIAVLLTAHHIQSFLPETVTTTSSKCQLSRRLGVLRLRWRAYAGLNFRAQRRTVS